MIKLSWHFILLFHLDIPKRNRKVNNNNCKIDNFPDLDPDRPSRSDWHLSILPFFAAIFCASERTSQRRLVRRRARPAASAVRVASRILWRALSSTSEERASTSRCTQTSTCSWGTRQQQLRAEWEDEWQLGHISEWQPRYQWTTAETGEDGMGDSRDSSTSEWQLIHQWVTAETSVNDRQWTWEITILRFLNALL